jgi:hypothetical protein
MQEKYSMFFQEAKTYHISVYPVPLFAGAVGSYPPSLFLVNGTATNLNPVGSVLSHDPWNVTNNVLKVESKCESKGAECAWKLRRGGVERVAHVVSSNVELGVRVN